MSIPKIGDWYLLVDTDENPLGLGKTSHEICTNSHAVIIHCECIHLNERRNCIDLAIIKLDIYTTDKPLTIELLLKTFAKYDRIQNMELLKEPFLWCVQKELEKYGMV